MSRVQRGQNEGQAWPHRGVMLVQVVNDGEEAWPLRGIMLIY